MTLYRLTLNPKPDSGWKDEAVRWCFNVRHLPCDDFTRASSLSLLCFPHVSFGENVDGRNPALPYVEINIACGSETATVSTKLSNFTNLGPPRSWVRT